MQKKNQMPIVLLMCLGIFICMIDSTIMNITLPAIQNDLHNTLETSSWMLNVYTMTIAVLAIPMARFADMFGRNKFYLLGLIIFGVGSLLCGLAASAHFLIVARFIQSLGAAILIPLSMVIGVGVMPIQKRAIPLTLLGATQGLSTALGPTVGGVITEKLDWHWVFYVNIPICIIGIIAGLSLLSLKQEKRVEARIDWGGLILSTASLFAATLVLIKGNTWGWGSKEALICYLVSIVSLTLFIVIEKKVQDPMVNLDLFKDRQFLGSVLIVSTGFVFLIGVMVLLPQFLTRFQEKTELEAALLITPVSAAIFIFSQLAALLVKKIGFVLPVIIGFIIMGSAYYLLSNLSVSSTSVEIIMLCSLLGIGFSFIIATATITSTSSFEGELLTASQGVFSMLRQVGVVLAVAIFVGGLTNKIEHNQEKTIQYATTQINQLNIKEVEKTQILQHTKDILNSEGGQVQESSKLSKKQIEVIVTENSQSILSKMPVEKREAEKPLVYKQVYEEVMEQQSQIEDYSKDVEHYGIDKISSSFSSLYKAAFPFVIICALLGLTFRNVNKRDIAAN
ncbi:DHA2 family efflux MFS transporter permease subunit [Priestia filamentosa]|uniref:MFS transporter n=1 Tax=Priestia filamentosa TaxID=1402861 RepID=UPI0039823FC2